jgi:hypothetical protein
MLAGAQCAQLGPTCSTGNADNPPDRFTGGSVSGNIYMSSPYSGPLLWFPGGKRYEIEHKLGCAPQIVMLYEAFAEQGTAAGSLAPCAGNMCLLQGVDRNIILIKNDTCSDFFVLVTATASCADADAGAGDAAGLDGATDGAGQDAAGDAASEAAGQ